MNIFSDLGRMIIRIRAAVQRVMMQWDDSWIVNKLELSNSRISKCLTDQYQGALRL